jgi:hypothetical protein
MASRAILAETIQSATGDVQGSTAVTVLETDGATPIGQVMYAAPTGGATLTNPLTTTTAGRVVAYATTAQRCKLRIGTAVYEAEFRPDPADILSSTNTALLTPTLTAPTVADYVRFTEQGSAPTSPDATHSDLYVGSDGNLYVLNDSGVPIRVILAGQAAIVNGDVAAGAAIALSKLAPGSAGLVRSNGTVLSAGNTITDTDVANGAGIAASKLATAGLAPSLAIANGYLAASVAGNALTIAIKTLADADPSASDQVTVAFRNATPGTGTYTPILLQSATSIVVSSGSTLGTANATAFRIWIVAFNDAGTLRLGVINCLSGTSIFPLAGWGIASSTAEGGAGAADSPQVFYSGVGVASKPYVVLGYATYETGLATAGTWTAGRGRDRDHGPALGRHDPAVDRGRPVPVAGDHADLGGEPPGDRRVAQPLAQRRQQHDGRLVPGRHGERAGRQHDLHRGRHRVDAGPHPPRPARGPHDRDHIQGQGRRQRGRYDDLQRCRLRPPLRRRLRELPRRPGGHAVTNTSARIKIEAEL